MQEEFTHPEYSLITNEIESVTSTRLIDQAPVC